MQVTLDGEPITGFESDKVRALLIYLAVEQGRPLRREALAALLFIRCASSTIKVEVRPVSGFR